ncbi:hypothetical protein F2Q69_00034158 [Brassica cretica]|uniref:Uncharacterized protein n=1 Tax=Brassica cretica TaxID=69181 RepID=A0A8S9SDS4_BRACR|nr:hypothetical protein F2Q69_00034158 [Brassica cretica]
MVVSGRVYALGPVGFCLNRMFSIVTLKQSSGKDENFYGAKGRVNEQMVCTVSAFLSSNNIEAELRKRREFLYHTIYGTKGRLNEQMISGTEVAVMVLILCFLKDSRCPWGSRFQFDHVFLPVLESEPWHSSCQ